jgi:hypothetical protein
MMETMGSAGNNANKLRNIDRQELRPESSAVEENVQGHQAVGARDPGVHARKPNKSATGLRAKRSHLDLQIDLLAERR